jgi:hypothetical protein
MTSLNVGIDIVARGSDKNTQVLDFGMALETDTLWL